MTNRQVFVLILVASAICVVISIYYFIPGIYHVLTFDGVATATRPTHALLFLGLAVVGVIASRFVLTSKTTKKS